MTATLRLVADRTGNPKRQELTTLPFRRGYRIVYRMGEVNRCPACGLANWHIGRVLAECGACGCALPIEREAGR